MDNLRLVLWVGVILLVWAAIQQWQVDYAPPPPPPVAAAAPPASADTLPAAPVVTPAPAAAPLPATVAPPPAAAAPAPAQGEIITVRTDVLDLQINSTGGVLQAARLRGYPVDKDQPDVPVELLAADPAKYFVLQSGLRAATAGVAEPNHLQPMRSAQPAYVLADGSDTLDVVLSWEAPGALAVDKIYRFRRGRYDIGLEYRLRNTGSEPYTAASYLQIQRLHNPPEQSYFDVESYSFTGPLAYDGGKYEKLDVADLADQPFRQQVARGWVAAIQHHFLAAAVPPSAETWSYDIAAAAGVYTMSAVGPAVTVAPGAEAAVEARFFVGPKLQAQLDETAGDLALTVDYGVLTLLAKPLFWLLQQIYSLVGNWGWAIVLATVLIKLLFYPLTEASGRSMAKMRKLQPRLKALQERYKEDRTAMSQALMDLYKREKVNPAAGCLPMLIQMPFFIAFYWVLLESVEMRQAPFALWISDLSNRDPYFILPALMAGAMFVQTSLNPAPPDPVQAKIMKWMPVVFAGMMAFFPAGLVLYWVTNTLLSIAQQWQINKKLGADDVPAAAS
ncbi:MAG: membrane protein insertase YidC [Gammaproteobacteria bacterium]|nr:membrane protein insertase YidC [Gammaproteobacteria bacterium]